MDVIWILEGDSRCLLQFLRQGHPSCRGQCGPEVEWSVCLFDSATKEFSVLTFDIQQTMSSFNYGRAFDVQSISEHHNMSILDVNRHDSDCRRAWAQQEPQCGLCHFV